jgi:hypothetical protein
MDSNTYTEEVPLRATFNVVTEEIGKIRVDGESSGSEEEYSVYEEGEDGEKVRIVKTRKKVKDGDASDPIVKA